MTEAWDQYVEELMLSDKDSPQKRLINRLGKSPEKKKQPPPPAKPKKKPKRA